MGAGGRDRVNPFRAGFNCPLCGVGSCAAPIAPEAFLRLTPVGRGSEQKKHNKSKAAAGKKPRWEKSEKQETASSTLMGVCNLGPGGAHTCSGARAWPWGPCSWEEPPLTRRQPWGSSSWGCPRQVFPMTSPGRAEPRGRPEPEPAPGAESPQPPLAQRSPCSQGWVGVGS